MCTESRPDDPYLDISRLTGDTGFEPAFDAVAAVAHYAAWRTDNPRRVRPDRAREAPIGTAC